MSETGRWKVECGGSFLPPLKLTKSGKAAGLSGVSWLVRS